MPASLVASSPLFSFACFFPALQWGWGGDHNLTTNRPMAATLSAATHWLGALSGLRVDSEGPTWLLGTQFEHHREIMYNLTGAKNVTLLQSQTEVRAAATVTGHALTTCSRSYSHCHHHCSLQSRRVVSLT
eukprot:SAG22_NODE_275_length_13171_cov_11.640606_5_plen_131_part_00